MKAIIHFAVVVTFLFVKHHVYGAPFPFNEDFESGLNAWSTNGTWGLTTSLSRSPAHAATDSPGAFYANNTDASLIMSSGMDWSSATTPAVRFYTRFALERDYDFVFLDVSTNAGANWTTRHTMTGQQPSWTRLQVDMDDLAGAPDVRFRFRLLTDASVVMDGFYVDDFYAGQTPAPVSGLSASTSQTMVQLSWGPDAGTDPDFAAYHIYRSTSTNAPESGYTLLAVLSDNNVTNWTDYAVSPKTWYHYRVRVISQHDLLSSGGGVSAYTPAGMDFPFLDNGEGGSAAWVVSGTWALATNHAYSGLFAWTDSPGGLYSNNQNTAITLAAPLSLAGKSRPVLSYTHRYHLLAGDNALVELSTNNGSAWISLANYTATSTTWQRVRHDLSAHTNASQVLVRFRLTTDASGVADGWWVDDISMSESPDTIAAPVLDHITSHSIRVNWAPYTNQYFSHFAVMRFTNVSVGINRTLAGVLADPAQTSLVDTNLALDTIYHYRVYAVNVWGAYSADSEFASQAQTLNNPMPFADDFEGSLMSWQLTGTWGVTDEHAASGTFSLTDSPYTIYNNNMDSHAQTALDIRGHDWPVLKFWDRHVVGAGDRGFLEISSNGSEWTRVYGVQGSRTDWAEQVVDLSPWKGAANLRIKFRFISDGSVQEDGWYIDAVSVTNHAGALKGATLYERFETGLTNWLTGGWWADTNGVYEGQGMAHNNIPGVMHSGWGAHRFLVYDGWLDLSGHASPQLVYWTSMTNNHWAAFWTVQVSTNGGTAWSTVDSIGQWDSSGWQRRQISLAGFRGTNVRLRAYSGSNPDYQVITDVRLDKLTIKDITQGTTLDVPVPGLKSVDLSWDPSAIGADFKEYRLYRSTDATVDLNDLLIGQFSDVNTTNMTDTGLSIGATYHYGIFVVDTNDIFSLVNTRAATTVPLNAPFADNMNDLTYWDSTGNWGPESNVFHSGTASLTESPNSDYLPNQDSYILTAVNLGSLDWPVLKFWDRHVVGAGDRGFLEISSNGSEWTRVYGVLGSRTDWAEQVVDLSPWKGAANLRIKFRFVSDGSVQADGWNIDAVSVTNHMGALKGTTLYERFETGLTNWLTGGWWADTNGVYEGQGMAHNNIPGVMHSGWGAHRFLVYDGWLDLSGHTSPQLLYWTSMTNNHWSTFWTVQVSTNGGTAWSTVDSIAQWDSSGWRRRQISLAGFRGTNVRLRAYSGSIADYHYITDVRLDKMTIKEITQGTTLDVPVPGLKSVDLVWAPSTIGADFKEYRLYRSMDATVDLNDLLIGQFPDVNTTNMTDTGLSIGATYHYGIFVVDTNDIFSVVSTRTATTVPLSAPFADSMNDLTYWDSTGNWGPDSNVFHSGSASLTESPYSDYGPNQDSYIMTAVNLGSLDWPVLKFWDRHVVGAGDRGYLEISSDGANWSRMYGVHGTRTEWAEHELDLSPWKGAANLRIRFRFVSDGSVQADGWNIDAVSVANHPGVLKGTTLYERFETGLTNWLSAGWWADTNGVYEGQGMAHNNIPGVMHSGWGAHRFLVYDGWLDLSGHTSPQLVYWTSLTNNHWSTFWYVQVSLNGGTVWSTVDSVAQWDSGGWQRRQASLAGFRGTNVRLRVYSGSNADYHPVTDVRLDKLTIKDIPAAVDLHVPVPGLKTVALSWDPSLIGADFKEYRLYRSPDATVNTDDVLVGLFDAVDHTSMTDSNLIIGATYYYGVYVVDTNDIYSAVHTRQVTTAPATLPFVDGMDSMDNWNSTGTWGVDTTHPFSGSGNLHDSPAGDYANNSDSYIQTSLNLLGSHWPVLSFRDRYAIGSGDGAWVEVSTDGSSFTRLYQVQATQTNWTHQSFDLSPWKNVSNLRVRFRLRTDGTGQADGWHVDDVRVEEFTNAFTAVQFFDGFENGLGAWIPGGWTLDTNAFVGAKQARSTMYGSTGWGANHILTLAGTLDLTSLTNPVLTYMLNLTNNHWSAHYQFQLSKDGGLNWIHLENIGQWSSEGWVKRSINLSAHRTNNVRLRVLTGSSYDYHVIANAWLDNVGIGDPAPGAPSAKSPTLFESVTVLRPVLEVWNAVDYQSDPLTYRFEVYSDEALNQVAAQIPSVASGATTTQWQVDVNLNDNAQYWWRAQANDGTNNGPWMAVHTFYVNETNTPPHVMTIAGPPKGATLRTAAGFLSWFPATDADVGDEITQYHIQISDDPAFATLKVDTQFAAPIPPPSGEFVSINRPLNHLDGYGALGTISNFFWRIRAQDSRFAWSAWTAGGDWFIYGVPPPDPASFTRNANGSMTLSWDVGTENWYIQWAPAITGVWQTIEGPMGVNSWTFTPTPHATSGFYRIFGE